jgi:deoxycytidine triphosphate deaminase
MSDIKYASTKEEADDKYKENKKVDPFPDIPPALLSSGHIQAYIARTGLVYPYFPSTDPKKEKLTQASLTMTIGPEVMRWDDKENRQYDDSLKKGAEIILPPNSITFLRPAERVNLPDYIAARFNLRIVHVHRGLLLGTGPLLDPGFKGYPMIPVHNLTDNEYRVQVGDDFIGVEFTKIEIGDKGLEEINRSQDSPFKYIENMGKTLDFEFPRYIAKNVPQRKVKSSLSAVIDRANKVVVEVKDTVEKQIKLSNDAVHEQNKNSRDAVEKMESQGRKQIIIGAITLAALLISAYALTITSLDIIDRAGEKINTQNNNFVSSKEFQDKIEQLQEKLNALESAFRSQEKSSTSSDLSMKHNVEIDPLTINLKKSSEVFGENSDKEKKILSPSLNGKSEK